VKDFKDAMNNFLELNMNED